MELSLKNKVAVVTGAGGLLGREFCAALARAGSRVVAVDIDEDALSVVSRELANVGEVWAHVTDITNASELARLNARVLQRYDRLDILVNNAAIDDKYDADSAAAESRFESYSVERFRRMLDVNVVGTFLCCQVLGSVMAARGSGSIINIASTYGVVAPDQSIYRLPDGSQQFFKSAAYPTSKGAVLQLTRFLACYWGERNVRVNALSPGGVAAGQSEHFQARYAARVPLGRMAQTGDYRAALVYLASDDSSYMTGANLVVDGGWTAW